MFCAFSQACDVSLLRYHGSLTVEGCGLEKWRKKWVENSLGLWAQRMIVVQIPAGAPQRLVWGSIMLNVLINNLGDGIDCAPRKFAGSTKWEWLIPWRAGLLFRES